MPTSVIIIDICLGSITTLLIIHNYYIFQTVHPTARPALSNLMALPNALHVTPFPAKERKATTRRLTPPVVSVPVTAKHALMMVTNLPSKPATRAM